MISEDGTKVHLFPTEGTSNTPWIFSNFDPNNITPTSFDFKWIVDQPNAEYYYVDSDDKCTYILTNYQAKNFRLICVDLNNYSSVRYEQFSIDDIIHF